MNEQPKYPNVTVKLIGTDGNAFAILGRMRQGLRAAKVPESEIKNFLDEAIGSDYNHILTTCMRWTNVS